MGKTVNIGIVGTQFMGRAHSNAWMDVDKFYDLPAMPVMKAACDNVAENLEPFCKRFGWEHTFIHEVGDFLTAIGTNQPIAPNFYDGLRNQQILDAMQEAAAKKSWIDVNL